MADLVPWAFLCSHSILVTYPVREGLLWSSLQMIKHIGPSSLNSPKSQSRLKHKASHPTRRASCLCPRWCAPVRLASDVRTHRARKPHWRGSGTMRSFTKSAKVRVSLGIITGWTWQIIWDSLELSRTIKQQIQRNLNKTMSSRVISLDPVVYN